MGYLLNDLTTSLSSVNKAGPWTKKPGMALSSLELARRNKPVILALERERMEKAESKVVLSFRKKNLLL